MLEAVPNVSEGRDGAVIAAIGKAFASQARLLDVHSDPDHHRSVFTLAGEDADLIDALLAGIARAIELVDLREHDGVHPRVGVADVVPLVPLRAGEMGRAKEAALEVADRVGSELGIPAFLYGEVGEGRRPAFFRRGGLEELVRRVAVREVEPAFGPTVIDPRAGVALVGAREPLVAYNVALATTDLEVAKAIAASVRESSGGLSGVQAIGLRLPRSGRIQVSMNIVDLDRTQLHVAFTRVTEEAAARGVPVGGGELVGLASGSVVAAAREARVDVPGIDESHTLERALAAQSES